MTNVGARQTLAGLVTHPAHNFNPPESTMRFTHLASLLTAGILALAATSVLAADFCR